MPSFNLTADNSKFLEDQKWALRTDKTTIINAMIDYFRSRPTDFQNLMTLHLTIKEAMEGNATPYKPLEVDKK